MLNFLPKTLTQTKALVPKAKLLTTQFPSIFRIIPERTPLHPKIIPLAKIIILLIASAYLLYATIKQLHLLQDNREYLKKVTVQRQNIEKEITYWKKITEELDNYPDAYLKIAELEYRLGNTQSSKTYLEKALSINPHLESGRVLGEQISR